MDPDKRARVWWVAVLFMALACGALVIGSWAVAEAMLTGAFACCLVGYVLLLIVQRRRRR